jgi:hypothetical protein
MRLYDVPAWEADARTRRCPLCKVGVGQRCVKGDSGVKMLLSHAVRGENREGARQYPYKEES